MKEIIPNPDYKTMWKVKCELNEQLKQQLEELQLSFNSVHKIMDRGQEENYKLKQQLEAIEKENRGLKMMLNHVAGVEHVCEDLEVKLAEAVEVIEFYLSKDLSDCIFKSDEDRHRQFLAKYRGEK